MLLLSKLNYRADWYLLRAKFTNDWNFFVVGLDTTSLGYYIYTRRCHVH